MTAKERKAVSLDVMINDAEIRLLHYVWAACCGDDFCDPLQSRVYSDTAQIFVLTSVLLSDGYIEQNPTDGGKFRLTKNGLKLFPEFATLIFEKGVLSQWRRGLAVCRHHNNLGIHFTAGSPKPSSPGFRHACRVAA